MTEMLRVDQRTWPGDYRIFIRRDPLHDTIQSIVVTSTGVDLGVLKEVHSGMLEETALRIVEIGEPGHEACTRVPCLLNSYATFVTEITGWSYRVEFGAHEAPIGPS